MKTSYELAMERLEKKAGKVQALTQAQKEKLAERDRQYQAAVAEVEIMMAQTLAAAQATGEPEKIQAAAEEKVRRLARARDQAETDKEAIRRGG